MLRPVRTLKRFSKPKSQQGVNLPTVLLDWMRRLLLG